MKMTRGARALIILGRYRRILYFALVELRRRLAAGDLTTRQLKALQDAIAGHREGMAFYRTVLQRICTASAAV